MSGRWLAIAASALLLAGGQGPAIAAAHASPAGAQEPSGSGGAGPLYGVTIDEIGQLEALTAGLAGLPRRPITRVYFDVHEPAVYYAHALEGIGAVSGVMGELLDSSDEKSISVAAFQEHVESYLQTLGSAVDVWEIGNEVNGRWTGSREAVAAKLTEAYDDVHAAGGRTALTLYANDFAPNNCGDGASEPTPLQFSERYVPARVAAGLDYVLLSYYPTQCRGREPSDEELAMKLRALHAVYPKAALGFGEVGLPQPARGARVAKAKQIMRWAYSLDPGLPYYVGGYFWWYGAEDALRSGAPLRSSLAAAFEDESAALAQPAPGSSPSPSPSP